jgi:hypothetical protein
MNIVSSSWMTLCRTKKYASNLHTKVEFIES